MVLGGSNHGFEHHMPHPSEYIIDYGSDFGSNLELDRILDGYSKRRTAVFSLHLLEVLGPMPFSGETASLCMCEENGIAGNETAAFILVGKMTLFPEEPRGTF
jgi:hypothetical protein